MVLLTASPCRAGSCRAASVRNALRRCDSATSLGDSVDVKDNGLIWEAWHTFQRRLKQKLMCSGSQYIDSICGAVPIRSKMLRVILETFAGKTSVLEGLACTSIAFEFHCDDIETVNSNVSRRLKRKSSFCRVEHYPVALSGWDKKTAQIGRWPSWHMQQRSRLWLFAQEKNEPQEQCWHPWDRIDFELYIWGVFQVQMDVTMWW